MSEYPTEQAVHVFASSHTIHGDGQYEQVALDPVPFKYNPVKHEVHYVAFVTHSLHGDEQGLQPSLLPFK